MLFHSTLPFPSPSDINTPPLHPYLPLSLRALREGPLPPEQGPQPDHHRGQLTHVLHIPPRERNRLWVLHRRPRRHRVMAGVPTPTHPPLPCLHPLPAAQISRYNPLLIDLIADFTTLDITVSRLFIGHKIV